MIIREFQGKDFVIAGYSSASVETFFYLKNLKLGIDAGCSCARYFKRGDKFYISHLHLDHWAGLSQLLFLNYLNNKSIIIYIAEEIKEKFSFYLENLKKTCGTSLLYELKGIQENQETELHNWSFKTMRMVHSRPSYGLTFDYSGKKKIAYSSDTSWQGIENNPVFFDYPFVLIESTFLAPEDKEKSKEHEHIHLEDIKNHFYRFQSEHIFLYHVSPRYSEEDKEQYLDYYFSRKDQKRIQFWNIL